MTNAAAALYRIYDLPWAQWGAEDEYQKRSAAFRLPWPFSWQ